MSWVRVATLADVPEGTALQVAVAGEAVCVYNVEGSLYATQDTCTHAEASLSEGYVIGDCIECPLHQALFHIPTGEVRCEPATEPLRVYEVRLDGEHVEVSDEPRAGARP